MRLRIYLTALFGLGLASCASVPTQLQGQFATTTPSQAASGPASGQEVRWGGTIIKVNPDRQRTCFEVLGRKLDINARPQLRSNSNGRFMACTNGFHDPEEYARGREITVVGQLNGTDEGKVGDFDYVYPHVDATSVYLWPQRTYYPRAWGGPYYDPFWYGGFGYGYPYGYGPWYGAPPVIIVPGASRTRPPQRPLPPPPPSRRR